MLVDRSIWILVAVIWLASPAPAIATVTFDWSSVDTPPNACDSQFTGCFGAVDYPYMISTYEVTNEQYVEFLNAVASSDPAGLYNDFMASDTTFGGIVRIGASEPFSYAAKAGFEQLPVVYVSFWDAVRFVNWLHNGQPVGAQTNASTEDGSYTLTAMGVSQNTVSRNAHATYVVPSEDEWYKAAYYDPTGQAYFDFPTRVSMPFEPVCVAPALDDGNAANCNQAVGALTEVGAYPMSVSAFGTLDQGGNVAEWNEAVFDDPTNPQNPTVRGLRGGGWSSAITNLGAFFRGYSRPDRELLFNGFRVALVPAPTGVLCTSTVITVLIGLRRMRSPRT